jgi:hypothetical protein
LTICNELRHGYQLQWNYFAMGHGKGKNGFGALLKKEIRKEYIKPNA